MKHLTAFLAILACALIFCSCNYDLSFIKGTGVEDLSNPTIIDYNAPNTDDQSFVESTASAEIAKPAITKQGSNAQTFISSVESQTVTIEETVLIDESGIKISAKSLEFSRLFDPALNVLIENNSGMDLTFQCRNLSVNGYMIHAIMSENVLNGKKSNTSIKLQTIDLKTCDISTIADIEFNFVAFN